MCASGETRLGKLIIIRNMEEVRLKGKNWLVK